MSEIDDLKAEINKLKSEIELKVNADNIITTINTSPEGIRIKGEKIFIDSETIIESGAVSSLTINPKDLAESMEQHITNKQQRKQRRYRTI